jgi:hypothetical protein
MSVFWRELVGKFIEEQEWIASLSVLRSVVLSV